MYYVYILRSVQADEVYTGFTMNLQRRLTEHNHGYVTHTSKFKPWQLVTYTAFTNEMRARAYEKYLKTGSGIAFARRHLYDHTAR